MVKKRQADFPKVQLKPGRPVGRKKNVTNTSFKAKKIVIQPSRAPKDQNQSTRTIEDLLQTMKATSKGKDFEELKRLINRDDSFLIHLSKIFDITLNAVLEDHLGEKTTASVEVIITVLMKTTDLQIYNLVPIFTSFLSCAMTHINIRVKKHSLNVLNCMLQTHPNLICNSMDILTNLLQMLTGPPRKWIHSQSSAKSHGKSSLEVMYSDSVYSPDWRVHVLGHINLFLTEMLKENPLVKDPRRDEQEVYWDCKAPLHLEIYANGGLKPVDIEKSLPTDFDDKVFYFDDSGSIEAFIETIIPLIPAIFIEEMGSEPKHDDDLLSRGSIVNLSILFQVLCRVCEWMHLISHVEMDASVKKFLKESVWDKNRFPFFQRGSVQEVSVVQLNLAVCFLFGKFLVDSEDELEGLNDSIFSYVMKVFKMHYTIKYESIPMIVKIMKIYLDKRDATTPEVLEFLKGCLAQSCNQLLKGNIDNPNDQLLISLFMKMSLDSNYQFLAVSDCLKHWFNWLFHHLMEIPKIKDKNKIDRKLLSMIKIITNQKYPCFLELLQKNDARVIKVLLNYDDDDVRDLAIFLIYNMKDVPVSVFQNLYRLISESKFPTRLTVRFIRLLSCRFSEKRAAEKPDKESIHGGLPLLDVIMFLLNVAIDCSSVLSAKLSDHYDDNKYTKAMKIYKGSKKIVILPSFHWKEHSVLFDACLKSLSQLDKCLVKVVAAKIVREIMQDGEVPFPMHSAIAILRLFKYKMIERQSDFRYESTDLKLSALLTTSVLTCMLTDDEWNTWSEMVEELTNSIRLDRETALDILGHLEYFKDDQLDGIVGYHILRMIKFFLEKQLLDPKDYKKVLKTMEILEDKTSEKTLVQQPLYTTLCRHLCGKAYYS